MNITEKIEDVRKKPQHIRERYVWAAVGICMFFVFIIWLFSLKNTLKMKTESKTTTETKIIIDTIE